MEQATYKAKDKKTAQKRMNPGWANSRYVHLKLIRKHIERWVKEHLIDQKDIILADMGCGEIPYESLVEPHVKQYIGVDLPGSPKATAYVDLATNRCNLEDNSCDTVWSVQVLEHVDDPNAYLKECWRILKPGGKLLLSTHGHWMYHPDPVDNWRWTSSGLKLEIERAGFEVTEVKGMMGLLPMSFQLVQDAFLSSFPFKKFWQVPFCFIMQRFIGLAEWYSSKSKTLTAYQDKDACIFFVVSIKPK